MKNITKSIILAAAVAALAALLPRRRITKDNLFKRREKFTYLSQLTRLK